MTDTLGQFLAELELKGCPPSRATDINSSGKIIRFNIAGDKPHSRNGRCQLWQHGDGFAAGWFMNMRDGEKHTWHSKATKKFTDAERREWVKKREADKKAFEAQKQADYAAAAEKATRIWAKAIKATQHGYLTRKGASGKGARVYKGTLVVPAYKAGRLVTLQFIAESGEKRFLTGGEIQGAYGSMGNETDTIYICEGYATADSVHKATGKATIWAFNAGNLKDVALAIRAKYPNSVIVIAGDNDQWTKKPDGSDWNVGVIKGMEAAAAVGGYFACPDVAHDDASKRTDWNDIALSDGLDYVRDAMAEAVARGATVINHSDDFDVAVNSSTPPIEWLESAPPIEAYDDEARAQIDMYSIDQHPAIEDDPEWRDKLQFDDKGKLKPASLGNVQLILAHSPKFKDMFCYDEFAHEKILVNCPDWENPDKFRPRPINDEDITWLAISLEKQGITLKMGEIKKVLEAVINKKRRNPAKEYFSGLVWDGKPRLEKWLPYYAGAEADDFEYVCEVGTKWLVAAVARVFEPGTKFDHVLILEGDQGAGKSTLLRELATIRGKSYFDDTIKVSDLGSDKTTPKLQGVLIIELAEMAGMRKADVDNLKQQITIQEDRLVQKYKNEASRFPRQFVMAGTINPVQGYLDDPTGNRRFLPVRAGKKIDIAGIKADREQLWAEAVVKYREGYPLWFGEELTAKLRDIQKSREIHSPWLEDIEKLCAGRDFVSNNDIWGELFIDKSRRTQKDLVEIGKVMVGLGFERSRKRVDGGEREYGWAKKNG